MPEKPVKKFIENAKEQSHLDELDFLALVEQETNFIKFYCKKFDHSALKVVKTILDRLESEGK